MPTLLDLTDDAKRLHSALVALGEMNLTDEDREQCESLLGEQLDAVGQDLAQKVDAYADLIRCLEAEEAAYDADLKALTAKRDARRNGAKSLKGRLQVAMETLGADSLVGARYKLALQANPASVGDVDEQAALAAGLAEVVQTVKVDRRAIVAAWKRDAESVPFASVTVGRSLRIR